MNKIYKVVRDNATGTYKAVSELGKSQGKGKGLTKKTLVASLALAMGVIANAADNNVIVNGTSNTFAEPLLDSVIAGGTDNSLVGGLNSTGGPYNSMTISGGSRNKVTSTGGAVGGGINNVVSSEWSVIAGGRFNRINKMSYMATIGGGHDNSVSVNPDGTGLTQRDESFLSDNGLTDSFNTYIANTLNSNNGYQTISGGITNKAWKAYTSIGGGLYNNAYGSFSTVSGGSTNASVGDYSSISGGHNNRASGSRSVVGGGITNNATGNDSVVGGGNKNTASGSNSTVIGGSNNVALGGSSIVGGQFSKAYTHGSIALGSNAIAGVEGGNQKAVAIGYYSAATGNQSFALGFGNTVAQDGTFVLGSNVETTQANSVILGNNSTDKAATSVNNATVGNLTYSGFAGVAKASNGVVSVGSKGAERQIVNVGAGNISATSTDAINGSQLFAVGDKVKNLAGSVAKNMGGDATVNSDGTINYTNIGGTGKGNINDAVAASKTTVKAGRNTGVTGTADETTGAMTYVVDADSASTSAGSEAVSVVKGKRDANGNTDYAVDLSTATKESLAKANTAVQSVTGDKNITATTDANKNVTVKLGDDITVKNVNTDSTTIGGKVTINNTGINAGNTVVKGVADGVNKTDAVNKGQLDGVDTKVSTLDGRVTANEGDIANNTTDISQNAVNILNNKQDIVANSTEIAKGMNFGDGKTATNFKLGGTVDLTNEDNNIVTTTTEKGVQFDLAKNIVVDSVKTGVSTLDNTGLKVGGVAITASGINANGQKITGLADATESGDAVSKAQLDKVTQGLNGDLSALDIEVQRLNDVDTATNQKLDTEAKRLDGVDTKLQGQITANDTASKERDTTTNTKVDSEVKRLDGEITTTNTKVDTEVQRLDGVDTKLQGQITANDTASKERDTTTNTKVDTEVKRLDGKTDANATEIAKGFNVGNGDSANNFKLGDTVGFTNGDNNLVATTTEKGVQFDLAKNIAVDSVKTGVSTLDNTGLKVGGVAITASGINANGQKITGLADATESGDAVNKKLLDATTANLNQGVSALDTKVDTEVKRLDATDTKLQGQITANDTASKERDTATNTKVDTEVKRLDGKTDANATEIAKGFNVGNGDSANNFKLGDTVGFTNGDNNLVATTTEKGVQFDLAKNIAVDSVKTGISTLDNTGLKVGGVTVTSSGINANGQKITGLADATAEGDAVNKKLLDATTANLNQGVSALDTKVDTEVNRLDGDILTTNNKLDGEVTRLDGAITTTNNKFDGEVTRLDGRVDATNNKLDTEVSRLDGKTDANATEIAKGFNVGNGDTTNNFKLGDTVSFTNSDSNIIATTTENGVQFDLADDVNLNSVTSGTTVLNSTGLNVDGVAITSSGINANNTKITNVADATEAGDAVNKRQLDTVTGGLNDGLTALDTKVDTQVKRLDGDILTTNNKFDGEVTRLDGEVTATNNKLDTEVSRLDGKTDANATEIAKGFNVGNGDTANNFKLGDTVSFTNSDNNLVATTTKDGVQFDLADDINLNSVTSGTTVLNGNGLNVDGVAITSSGINANGTKVTNIADATEAGDAVNKRQLDTVTGGLNGDLSALDTKVDTQVKRLDGDILTTNNKLDDEVTRLDGKTDANTAEIAKGFNVGNGDSANNFKLGDTVSFTNSDNNLVATTTKDGVQFNLADTINVNNANLVNANIKSARFGDVIEINASGINANNTKIVNVANATEAGDAVNFGQLNEVKTGLNDGLTALDTKVNTQVEHLDGKVTATNDKLDSEVGRLDGEITATNEKFTGEVGRLDGEITATNDKVKTEVSRLDGAIATTNEKFSNEFVRVDKDISNLSTKVDTEVSRLDGKVDANTNLITKVDQKVDTEVGRLDGKITATNDKLASEIGRVEGSIVANNQEVSNKIASEVGRVDTKINAEVGRLDGEITTTNNKLNAEVTRIDGDVVNTNTRIDATNANVVEVAKAVNMLDEKGNIVQPTYNVSNNSYRDVGSAFEATNNRIDNLAQSTAQEFGYVRQDMRQMERSLSAGIASASAVANAPYVAGKWTYSANLANFNSESAVGISLRKTADNGRWSIEGGASTNTENDPLFRIGISGVID